MYNFVAPAIQNYLLKLKLNIFAVDNFSLVLGTLLISLPAVCIISFVWWIVKKVLCKMCSASSVLYFNHCIHKKYFFIALIHPIQWTIALPVGATGPAKRQKKSFCIEYRQDRSQSVHLPGVASCILPV